MSLRSLNDSLKKRLCSGHRQISQDRTVWGNLFAGQAGSIQNPRLTDRKNNGLAQFSFKPLAFCRLPDNFRKPKRGSLTGNDEHILNLSRKRHVHIRNTPKRVSSIGAFNAALNDRASTSRDLRGSMMPSSQSRAEA